MNSYFTVNSKKDLLARRISRISHFSKLPVSISLRLVFYYARKLFGLKGTSRQEADNYYFLTLVNADAASIEHRGDLFTFRTSDDLTFKARKLPSSDLETFNQVWGREDYFKAVELVKASDSNKEQITIIDAGANVGYSAIYFYKMFPGARIFSIEPDADNYSLLNENLRINNLTSVTAVRAGFWKHRSYLSMVKNETDNREWAFQVVESPVVTDLQGMHITDFISLHNIASIDLLKIDIEGAESYLFEDEDKAREFLSITKVIAIEIHDHLVSRSGITRILTDNGFELFNYSDLTIGQRKSN